MCVKNYIEQRISDDGENRSIPTSAFMVWEGAWYSCVNGVLILLVDLKRKAHTALWSFRRV